MKLVELLSKNPVDLYPTDDKEILQLAIVAEFDAVSLYQQLASKTKNPIVKKILLNIAREEKTHIGEFQELLKRIDVEYSNELISGAQEINEIEK